MKLVDRQPCFSKDAFRIDSSARRYSDFWFRRGIASEFIHHLPELLATTRNRRAVVYHRVSRGEQRRRGNLDEGTNDTVSQVRALGCAVVGVFKEDGHASVDNEKRSQLRLAIDCAALHGAILVAASRDRFLRNFAYRGENDFEKPLISEYKTFMSLTAGIMTATLLHPDQPARSSQTIRGQKAKKARVGRPCRESQGPGWTKRRKDAYLHWAQAWRDEGKSLRWISKWFGQRPHKFPPPHPMTLHNWFERAAKPNV